MSQPGDDSLLQQAIAHHQASRFADAERLYRTVLATNPSHVDALHYLGVLAAQFGRQDAALDLITRALSLRPDDVEIRFNRATNLAATGKLDESIAEFQRVLLARPDDANAHLLIADIFHRANRHEQSIAHLRQTLALHHANPDAHNNLGNLLQERGDNDEAILCFQRSLALRPGNPQTLNNLGNAQRNKGDLDAAISTLKQAVELMPSSAPIRTNLASALSDRGQVDAAIAEYRLALIDSPTYAEAWNYLGITLRQMGRIDEASTAHLRALTLRPDYAEARHALAWVQLLQGQFEEGLRSYESRPRASAGWARFPNPWKGEALAGRTILLHAEQGFGDTFQFGRYASVLSKQGARVILECQRELLSVLTGLAGIEALVAREDALPSFDVHCPLMSVPFVLGTRLDSIPSSVPYLDADPIAVANWSQRLKGKSGRQIGLVWSGRKTYSNDRNRSMRLSDLSPLAAVEGMTFHSLQTGQAGDEIALSPPGFEVIDHRHELKDFADTAALIANLDLVISIDTAVAHLAGAMGRPVWTMLPLAPDWRWLLDREDSPWYPTMRLFRQRERGNWGEVVARIANALE